MDTDRLYTVNPYNKRHLNGLLNHSFALGGPEKPYELPEVTVTPNSSNHNWFGLSKENNPFSKQNAGGTMKGIAAGILNSPEGDKLLDDFDPIYKLAGGRESTIGNGLSTAGKGLFKAGAMSGNGALMAAGAGVKIVGGLYNTLGGVKYNKENISKVKNNISDIRNSANDFLTVNNSDTLINNYGNSEAPIAFSKDFLGKDGVFRNKIGKMKKDFDQQMATADAFRTNALMKAVDRVDSTTDNIAMANTAAFGGPLDTMNNMGAAEYGLMSDYINMRNNQTAMKNNIPNTYFSNQPITFADGGGIHIAKSKEGTFTAAATKHNMGVQEFANYVLSHPDKFSPAMRKKANFARNASKWHGYGGLLNNYDTLFALGGDLQTNGGDYSDGLTYVDAGSTHEQNPNGGVQMGVAPDGQPNLVEEGEVIYNDYVYSNRLKPTKDVLKKLHVFAHGGKLTYADVAKKLDKESQERPNDPISRATLKAQMEMLAQAQEEQKTKEEVKKAKEMFDNLSPEEQKAIMEQALAQQQGGQEGDEGQEDNEEQENPQEVSPEEAKQYAEEPQESNPQEEQSVPEEVLNNAPQEGEQEAPVVGAYGGELHTFDDGGPKEEKSNDWKKKLSNTFGLYTAEDWNDFAKKNKVEGFDFNKINDLSTFLKQEALLKALSAEHAAQVDALRRGDNLGTYVVPHTGYLIDDFIGNTLNKYNGSLKRGYKPGNYAIDKNFPLDKGETVYDLEGKDFYKNYTNAGMKALDAAKGITFNLKDGKLTANGKMDPDTLNLLNAIYATSQRTKTATKGFPIQFLKKNKDGSYSFIDNASNLFNHLRNDQHLGAFHLTPKFTERGNDITSLLWNPNSKTYSILTGDPQKGWNTDYTTEYDDDKGHHKIIYYRAPEAVSETTNDNNGETNKMPYDESGLDKLRYAGLAGPATALGMWSMGIGKPDYVGLDDALRLARTNSGGYADYKPIGNYFEYRPMDIWMNFNKKANGYRALDRAIANNNAPIGTNQAALLANGQNELNSSADDVIKAKQYNDNLKLQTGELNQKTDLANAEGYDKAALTNAELRNRDTQFNANLAANIAAQKMDADAGWYNALYGNLGKMFAAAHDLGRETKDYNRLAALINSGWAGTPSRDMIEHGTPRNNKVKNNTTMTAPIVADTSAQNTNAQSAPVTAMAMPSSLEGPYTDNSPYIPDYMLPWEDRMPKPYSPSKKKGGKLRKRNKGLTI